ncbi:hypothetical protein GF322_03665 [Candidatus Dependentiae bacterium]|nr:hypothetical protein [Candidatus Dependentiae bacterium]
MNYFLEKIKILIFFIFLIPGFLEAKNWIELYKNELNNLFDFSQECLFNRPLEKILNFSLSNVENLTQVVLNINTEKEININAENIKQEVEAAKQLKDFLSIIYYKCSRLRLEIGMCFNKIITIEYLIYLSSSWTEFYREKVRATLKLEDAACVQDSEVSKLYLQLLRRAAQETKHITYQEKADIFLNIMNTEKSQMDREVEQAKERLRTFYKQCGV